MKKNFNLSDLLIGDPNQSKIKIRPHEEVMEEILGDIGKDKNVQKDAYQDSKEKIDTILLDSKNS